ncbi:hypothetical protein N7533_013706 [Penicillium manginii]|uniref:uncharacterized protein n=1 Tax=Penicillium manginii TaxID=203109 RepID=UPI002546CDAF|nr:uncharacterized protein N7533_013706 [Penicillium manginii]KAJ5733259.1 hypothetical protein N7533_013706 [Penicillium manginii]
MPNGISKRQQLRNEKTLAELIRTIPGNDRCADCDALTPGWASWNMGIFLCMRCAALHRKLGTHISKVKSLSMDTWSSEQVDVSTPAASGKGNGRQTNTPGIIQNMKSHGNNLMNKIYNPKNIKPSTPVDVDEADSCMERFIRQKYQYRSLEDGKPKPPSRDDESYNRPSRSRRDRSPVRSPSRSPEGSPPPLPPKTENTKTGSKFFGFGLRGSASTSNLRRFGTKSSKASPNPDLERWSPPSSSRGPERAERGLGAPVADVTTDSFEAKMAALREMGFTNDRRNEMVLRGLNEDLNRSAETLSRLGEGNGSVSARARTPAPTSNTAPAPLPTAPRAVTPNPQSLGSNNPFERSVSNPVPQQQPQSTTTSYNPFDQLNPTPTSAQPLEASFQNLQVSQPLFPHSTGGFPNQAQPQATYQPSFAPSATLGQNQGGYVSSPQAMDSNYNPFFQTTPQPQGGVASQQFSNPVVAQNNPFFNAPQNYAQPQQSAAAPTLAAPRPPQHANTMPAVSSSSPFGTSPFGSTPFQTQQQPQQNQNVSQGSYNPFQQAMPTPQSAGPFTTQPQFPPQQVQQQQQPQQQQLVPQTTGQMNKNGILSLYNLAPSPAVPQIPNQFQQQQQQPQAQYQPQAQPQAQPFNGMATSPIPPLTNSLTTTPQTQPGSAIPTPPNPLQLVPWHLATPSAPQQSARASQPKQA